MTTNLYILFFILLFFSSVSFLLSKKSFFCFSATTPILFGLILIPFTNFSYYEISILCISEITLLCFSLLLFDILVFTTINNQNYYLTYINKLFNTPIFRYISLFLLSLGLLGFFMKLRIYGLDYNPLIFINIIINSPKQFAENFSSGYSIIHYSGLLGLLYFGFFKLKFHIIDILIVFVLIAYLFSLLLLMIKIQFIIGIYILFWSLIFSSLNSKKLILKLGLFLVSTGTFITIVDNFLFSNDIMMAFEFLIRYLIGGIEGLSQFLDSDRQIMLFDIGTNIVHRLDPLLQKLGVNILLPDKVFYKVGQDLGTTNVGTIIQSLALDFGLVGWTLPLLIFISLPLLNLFFASKSYNCFVLLIPITLLTQVSLSLVHMGNAFWKFEFLFIFLLHVIILSTLFFLKTVFPKTRSL